MIGWRQKILIYSSMLLFLSIQSFAQEIKLIENLGQWDEVVKFRSEVNGGHIYVGSTGFTFDFTSLADQHQISRAHIGKGKFPTKIRQHAYKVNFKGANTNPNILAKDIQAEYYNYFIGSDETKWGKHAQAFGSVYYESIYPNIDLDLYSAHQFLKYDVIVQPGGDASLVAMEYNGVDKIKLVKGAIHIKTSVNEIIEEKPYAYQWVNGTRKEVPCAYRLNENVIQFDVGEYDKTLPLIIDPVLRFSTFSGSFANNFGYTATYDGLGYLYSGSSVFGTGYPTVTGSYDVNFNGGIADYAISKYDTTGTALIYSTYVGGSGDELPHSLVVNEQDELYIFGTTSSSDYPTTSNAFQSTFQGGPPAALGGLGVGYSAGADIFVSRLSAGGDDLLSSTLLGGTNNDGLNLAGQTTFNYADEIRGEIDLDEDGNVYIATCTYSLNFPVTANAFQSTLGGGQDGITSKFSPDLSELLWSSYYGGSNNDGVYSLAIDSESQIVITGGSGSTDLPVTPGALSTTYNGGETDAFAAKFSLDGSALITATYLGTSTYDQAYFVELDSDDNVHLFGQTTSGDEFVFNALYNGANSGQFISKLNEDMSAFIWSTTFGTNDGFPDISPTAFLVDLCSRIYLSGWGGPVQSSTSSTTGLPVTPDAFQSTTDGGDFYLFVIEEDASSLIYASYFGGTQSNEHVDGGTSRFDRKGKIYQSVCAGCQGNSDFPISPSDAVSSTNNSGGCNNGVFKFDFDLPGIVADFNYDPICLPDPVAFVNNSEGGLTFNWDFGDNTTSEEMDPVHTYTAPGVYEVTLIIADPMSCNLADTITQDVIILQEEDFELEDFSICNGEPTQLGFDPIPSAGYTYSWTPADQVSNPNISNPTTNVSQSTTFTLTVSNGVCESSGTQQVNVVEIDALFPEDEVLCEEGLSQILVVDDYPIGSTFIWSESPTLSDPLNADPSSDQITVNPGTTNTYYVQVTSEGCELEESVTVFVEPFEVELPEVIELCENEANTVTAVSTNPDVLVNYIWTANDAITGGLNQATINVSTAENTYLYVDGVSTNGCTANDSILLNINFIDLALPLDTIICEEAELDLVANTFGTADSFIWSDDPGFTNILSTDSVITVSPEVTTTYYFQGENFCDINGQVQVTIVSELFDISPDIFLCANDDLTLTMNGPVGQDYTVDWSPDASIITGDGTAEVSVLTDISQDFIAEVTTADGCIFSDTVFVEVSDLSNLVVEATADETVIPQGGSTVLHATPADDFSITWTPSAPLSSASSSDPTATLFNTTTFNLLIQENNANGFCQRGDSITISVFEFGCDEPTIFVPNAFSPNNDGFNDSLYVRSDYVASMELSIYDRWGEKVFQTNDQSVGWDGKFNGKLASPAVYVYQREEKTWKVQSDVITNPALTGKHRGTMRFTANQRQQWKSVTVPFNTFAFSAETNRIAQNKNISAGLSILNDKAGDSKLNTLQINLSSAYVFSVNADSSAQVRLGVQTGFSQKKIDFTDLRFDEQYNGFAFDPSLPNFENAQNLKSNVVNLNLGLDFNKVVRDRQSYGVGISLFNLLKPTVSFLGENDSRLSERLSLQGFYHQDISKDLDIILSSQAMWQGTFREQIAGVQLKKIWHDNKVIRRAGYIGTFMRVKDSGYLLLAMDYDDWKFGVSYDFNYSPLNVASRYRGGLELSVIYILDIFNEKIKAHRACPDFI